MLMRPAQPLCWFVQADLSCFVGMRFNAQAMPAKVDVQAWTCRTPVSRRLDSGSMFVVVGSLFDAGGGLNLLATD